MDEERGGEQKRARTGAGGKLGIRNVDGAAIQSVGQTSKLLVRRLGLVARLGRSFTFVLGN